jgi:GntR family transcriptional regulator
MHHLVSSGLRVAQVVSGAVHQAGGLAVAVGPEEMLSQDMRRGLVARQALHGIDDGVDAAANGATGVEFAVDGEHFTKVLESAGVDGHGVAGDEIGEVQPVACRQRSGHRDTIPCGRLGFHIDGTDRVNVRTMDMSRLDRSSSLPLWAQLEAELRQALDAGLFDERFPTDLELTRRYGVSRHTVRDAVGRLQADGLLRRVRGRGTVVERPEFEQRLGALYSLFSSIEAAGVVQRSEVIDMGITENADVASRLELDADAELFRLERIRFADDEPLAIDTAWLPAALGRPLLDADFGHTALYDELQRCCDVRPDRGWERIAPVIPSPAERELLGAHADEAAFQVERVGQHAQRTIEWRVTLIRGDRYRFFADWSTAGNSVLRLAAGEPE